MRVKKGEDTVPKMKRFNQLPLSKQKKVLEMDGVPEQETSEMCSWLSQTVTGGPLVDTNSLQIMEW